MQKKHTEAAGILGAALRREDGHEDATGYVALELPFSRFISGLKSFPERHESAVTFMVNLELIYSLVFLM